jgi:hypothetical protein
MKTPKFVSSNMLVILIAILSTCTFAACSKDEDDPQTPDEIDYEEIQFSDIKAKELELSSSSLLIADAVAVHSIPQFLKSPPYFEFKKISILLLAI